MLQLVDHMGLHQALLLSLLLAAACQQATANKGALFFENFDGKWASVWKHSGSAKYTGQFEAARPEDWTNQGLKVS